MSIGQFLASHVFFHRLWVVPSRMGLAGARGVYATQEVWDMLNDLSDTEAGARHAIARAQVDGFTEGLRMSLRMPPSKNVEAQIALMDERSEEIWEIRARDPRPGIRLFGRFAAKNEFVALTWDYKENCITQEDNERQKDRCKQRWKSLFAELTPFQGENADDYVSKCTVV